MSLTHEDQQSKFGIAPRISPETIDRHIRRGRQLQSQMIANGFKRGLAALRRGLSGLLPDAMPTTRAR